jgi:TolB-like protein
MKPLHPRIALAAVLWLASLLAACSTLDAGQAPALEANARWAVLPFANNTETPLAGSRAEAIAEALLRARGVAEVRGAPAGQQDALLEPTDGKSQEAALDWARKEGARYALAGHVDEWRYKVGVDGEPAVGVALSVIDVQSGKTLWSGVGARSGWSRESLAAVAQKLMRELLDKGVK